MGGHAAFAGSRQLVSGVGAEAPCLDSCLTWEEWEESNEGTRMDYGYHEDDLVVTIPQKQPYVALLLAGVVECPHLIRVALVAGGGHVYFVATLGRGGSG